MRVALSFLTVIALAACSNVLEGGGLTEADIDGIQPGNANGIIFSGTWKLTTEVTESTCGGLVGVLPGVGDKDEEDITFAQTGGELTRVFDDVGDFYTFRGSVNQDGTFIYGQYYDLTEGLPASFRYLEIVEGKVQLENGAAGAMEATARRRYQSGVLDCSANVTITGKRGNLIGE
ncbi:MAG: hypothetical protein R3F60_02840 [bacterium]